MAQVVEHILGKDEVTSSNLVSSSGKKLLNLDVSGFEGFFLAAVCCVVVHQPHFVTAIRTVHQPRKRLKSLQIIRLIIPYRNGKVNRQIIIAHNPM